MKIQGFIVLATLILTSIPLSAMESNKKALNSEDIRKHLIQNKKNQETYLHGYTIDYLSPEIFDCPQLKTIKKINITGNVIGKIFPKTFENLEKIEKNRNHHFCYFQFYLEQTRENQLDENASF